MPSSSQKVCDSAACSEVLDTADGSCKFCPQHCHDNACTARTHVMIRGVRARPACTLDRAQVANDYDGSCPCGAPLVDHPKAPTTARYAGDIGARPAATGPPGSANAPAAAVANKSPAQHLADVGLTAEEIAAHPFLFTTERWAELIGAIKGRSLVDRKLDRLKTECIAKPSEHAPTADSGLRDLAANCTLPGGRIAEFAGLLAAMRSITIFNEDASPAQKIMVQRSSLCDGSEGALRAEEALNGVAIQRLSREGRTWFQSEVGILRDEHRGDAAMLVMTDPKKNNEKKTVVWVDRCAKVLLASYFSFIKDRKPTWEPDPLIAYMSSTAWRLPVRNSVASLDLTAFFVQAGLLSLVNACEKWELLGESLLALRAHLAAVFRTFQTKFVLCAANLNELKQIQSARLPPGGGGRGQNGAGLPPNPFGGRGAGPGQQPNLQMQRTALAQFFPGALRAGLAPGTTVFTACTAPGCPSVPAAGWSSTPFCFRHDSAPANLPPHQNGGRGIATGAHRGGHSYRGGRGGASGRN